MIRIKYSGNSQFGNIDKLNRKCVKLGARLNKLLAPKQLSPTKALLTNVLRWKLNLPVNY